MPATRSSLKTEKKPEGLRLVPKEDLVASTVESLRLSLTKALEGAKGGIILDLNKVQQIDSLGITLVLGLFKTCQKQGLEFRIEGAHPDIQRVFKLFNLTKFFSVAEAARE